MHWTVRGDRAVRTVSGVYVFWCLQIHAEQKVWVHQAQVPQCILMKREDWPWEEGFQLTSPPPAEKQLQLSSPSG